MRHANAQAVLLLKRYLHDRSGLALGRVMADHPRGDEMLIARERSTMLFPQLF
jgi:hypothetical protein